MSKYLIKTTEQYRVDTETEVTNLIEEAKSSKIYELKQYNSKKKEVVKKGEIEDTYYLVTLYKTFNEEKFPDLEIELTYNKED